MKVTIQCETCDGSGVHFEDHGMGQYETLGCGDCEAKGFVELVMSVVPWCAEHDLPIQDNGNCWLRGTNPCRLEEPARHYRIEET